MKRAAWVVGGVVLALWAWEQVSPRRRPRESTGHRWGRNAVVAALGSVVVSGLEKPIVHAICRQVEEKHFGLLGRLPAGSWGRRLLSIALLDYTLYWWHLWTHRVPWLWRFHAVHHLDRDMDFTTAARFHFGELLLSIPWRATQVAVLGIDRAALASWELCLFVCVLFHHSNSRLSPRWENALHYFIVTPSMHGLHHSVRVEEMDTNWSSGLSLWDRLHGTLLFDPQRPVVVGIPEPADTGLASLLRFPFTRGAGRPHPA